MRWCRCCRSSVGKLEWLDVLQIHGVRVRVRVKVRVMVKLRVKVRVGVVRGRGQATRM